MSVYGAYYTTHIHRIIVHIASQFMIDPESLDRLVVESEGCFLGTSRLQI